ncbi:MAG: methionine--tRNA ligase [Phycisphaeraceae bacterium]
MTTPKFYITTPIYYVNDRPHIGHVYTTTVADIVARYHRLMGQEVFFLTGVDEHAAKVVEAAEQRGVSPQAWADQNAAVFKQTFAKLGISNDDFVRTSEDRHKQPVLRYVAALLESGDVYAGQYEGWYDAGQEEYVTDSKAQEYQFKSPINGKPLIRKQEKNYFFRLEKYREAAAAAIRSGQFKVEPEARRNEILNRLADAKDVPISRSGTGGWGIPMPNDPEQSIYVWIDALFNYLSYVDSDERRDYWAARSVHLIAKDILWFHAAIWPAILLALRQCPGFAWVELPQKVYAHSFWISEGQKMSKSLGNFVDLEKLDHYVATFSLDALRWYLASNGPLGTTDSDFAEAKFIDVYNSELANTIGNCFSRVTNMTNRYFGGKLPAHGPHVEASAAHATDAEAAVQRFAAAMDQFDLAGATVTARALVSSIDNYIEETAPFKRAKDPAKLPEVGTILYNCAEAMRIASLLLWPIIPSKAEEIWRRLSQPHYGEALANGRGDLGSWTKWGQLQPGTPILQGEALFPRYQPEK